MQADNIIKHERIDLSFVLLPVLERTIRRKIYLLFYTNKNCIESNFTRFFSSKNNHYLAYGAYQYHFFFL